MGLDLATGGGDAEFFPLKEMCEAKTLVVFRVRELHPEEPGKFSKLNPVTADVLICSGSRSGEVFNGERFIHVGVTNPLRKSGVGKDVAALLQMVQKTGNPFPAADTPTDAQVAEIEKTYQDGKGFAAGGLAKVGAPAANTAVDDEPPF